ncbi:hypothetical protein MUN76_06480 [Leucobacter rhizosphaerae]|uniref:Secreted protein n=1 Tax=Leucobacter rhizosphaerae TaxID=2932245 RepID=A0ABY4FZB2_9MICO|nr:hypothetical protein [Leucobacter rhizosphaerae]UOQ61598.1 hypothetical protein MUN76_06480 [Leucobacter rhizosphaerae]
MFKTRRKAAAVTAACALALGGLSVAAAPPAPAEAAGYTYLYETDFETFSACNTKRLTMNSSWTRSSQCFIFYDTDANGNRVGPNVWKFTVSVRG